MRSIVERRSPVSDNQKFYQLCDGIPLHKKTTTFVVFQNLFVETFLVTFAFHEDEYTI